MNPRHFLGMAALLLLAITVLPAPAQASPGCSLSDGHALLGAPDCVVWCVHNMQIYTYDGSVIIAGCTWPYGE